MKFYLGVTDNKWFRYLLHRNPEDVNFWQLGGNTTFKGNRVRCAVSFQIKIPIECHWWHRLFLSHTFLPLSIAWDTFQNRNGCETFDEFSRMILNHRSDKQNINPTIGCSSYGSYFF